MHALAAHKNHIILFFLRSGVLLLQGVRSFCFVTRLNLMGFVVNVGGISPVLCQMWAEDRLTNDSLQFLCFDSIFIL